MYWISYLTYLGVAWYALGIGYLFGALLGPLQVRAGGCLRVGYALGIGHLFGALLGPLQVRFGA